MFSRGTRISVFLLALAAIPSPPPLAAAEPTAHAFELMDDGDPRIFFRHRERRVPLRVRNEGFVTWRDDTGFAFSYMWLSPRGERVAEGFRTRLPGDVAPEETIALVARVKELPAPGIYRMRWDMVQEGVTWFSEKDRTPEPARWVLVLPPLELFLVLIFPCLAAIGGFFLWKMAPRSRWPFVATMAAGADLIWVAVSLYGKPFLLYAELPRRFTPEFTWANASAVAVPLLVLLLLPLRWRTLAAWMTVAAAAFLVWGQTLYLRFFGDVATSAAVLASRQTGEIKESIGFLAGASDWWLLPDLLLAIPLLLALRGARAGEKPRRLAAAVILLVAALPLGAGLLGLSDYTRGRNLRTLRDVREFGLYGYQILDLSALAADSVFSKPPSGAEIDAMASLFLDSAASRAAVGPSAAIARGKNLLAIQAESMQQFVLDFEVGGQPVTPNLRRLAESALMFTAVQDQTSRGRSSAGDFVVNTSLLPVAESVAYQYADNDHRGFAHALRDQGYETMSAIPYKRHFWNRRQTHPAYGFASSLFVEDFTPGINVGWGLNDVDFLQQMVPRLTALPEPFAAWLTTLSVHHPYREFPDELKVLDFGELEDTPLGNYLHGMSLLDRAIGAFFERLEEAGLLERTVIALWGDHSSGLLREEQWVDYFQIEKSGAKRFQFRRVPFIVWVPEAPALRGRDSTPAGQVDIAPTLLALLGGKPDKEPFLGRNLLGAPGNAPVVHPQGSWVNRDLLYLNPREDIETVRCWEPKRLKPRPGEACREGSKLALEQIELSELILRYDLQTAIGERLAVARAN